MDPAYAFEESVSLFIMLQDATTTTTSTTIPLACGFLHSKRWPPMTDRGTIEFFPLGGV